MDPLRVCGRCRAPIAALESTTRLHIAVLPLFTDFHFRCTACDRKYSILGSAGVLTFLVLGCVGVYIVLEQYHWMTVSLPEINRALGGDEPIAASTWIQHMGIGVGVLGIALGFLAQRTWNALRNPAFGAGPEPVPTLPSEPPTPGGPRGIS